MAASDVSQERPVLDLFTWVEKDFGLDVDAFENMLGDCPPAFFSLAVTCCNMSASRRPSFSDIVLTLEGMEKEGKREKLIALDPVVDVSPYRRRSSPCHHGDRGQLTRLGTRGLARSQSDVLPPALLTPPLLGTPPRVNPFSLRRDLNGGRCKLLDTPSKSVISLTFALPALRDPCGSSHLLRGTPPRRCQSLPCTPEINRTPPRDVGGKEEEEAETGEEEDGRRSEGGEDRLQVGCLGKDEETVENFAVELEMVSLERLEEEEEEVCPPEPMDCTKSPEPAEQVLNSSPGSSLLTCNGWRLPVSNQPCAAPPPRLDNNNGSAAVIGQQVQWGGGGRGSNGFSEVQVLSSDHGGASEQDEVISCPGCCLVGLSFPSLCLRGSASVPASHRRASLLRQRSYRNLNGTITGSGAASSAASTDKPLLGRNTNGRAAGPSVACEPGRSLPEAQS